MLNNWGIKLQMLGIDNIFNFVGGEYQSQHTKSFSTLTFCRRPDTDMHLEWGHIQVSSIKNTVSNIFWSIVFLFDI
jgi:hypothetical protein